MLRLLALPTAARKMLVFGLDCSVCALAAWFALWLRLGEWEILTDRALTFLAMALTAWIASAAACQTYRSVMRFAGPHTMLVLMRTCGLVALLLAAVLLSLRIDSMPRTLSVIHPIILFLGLVGERMLISQVVLGALKDIGRAPEQKRVLIYGAGVSGEQLAASMRNEPGFKILGFIDHNPMLRDRMLEGKRIWHTSDLELVLKAEDVDEVFLALPSAKRSERRSIVERIRQSRPTARVRVLPTFSQIASGRVSVSDLREVQIEELLGRDEVAPNRELMERNIAGRAVLVTGAGGSIGSELCRQIIKHRPAALILAERSEHALYSIDLELRETAGRAGTAPDLHPVLIDVADEEECKHVLRRFAVDTVFHAAAYKHVPLVERNPIAGIRNNVLSTLALARASESSGVAKFILVSTDKAVRPTSVMGASKRVCELIVQGRAAADTATSYCSVRFGNVLGSSGSVIPLFREQIARGGPITVTRSDATRYFMTIPEAAQLVIQAGALAGDGEVLLLDMGEPVKIGDLARLMIELSGLTVADRDNPDGDIAIEEIGLRPGEKLIEELLIGDDCHGTAHPRIVKARETMIHWQELETMLGRLLTRIGEADVAGALQVLSAIVPEFHAPSVQEARDTGDIGSTSDRRPMFTIVTGGHQRS